MSIFFTANASMLLVGCAVFGPIFGFDQTFGTLFNYNQEIERCGNVELAPTIFTKEGFPIIDDQAPIMFPCSEVLGETVSSLSGGSPGEPSVGETTNSTTDEPTTEPTPDDSKGSKQNNGHGNGDQDAPGGSCTSNSAENIDC